MSNEGRFDKRCGDCYYFLDERIEGNQFSGGAPAGDCHGAPPDKGGWPMVAPDCLGCAMWKKSTAKPAVITSVAPKEEECQSTNTDAVPVGENLKPGQKPFDESVPLSRADVGQRLSSSPPVLDSPSGARSTPASRTAKKQ